MIACLDVRANDTGDLVVTKGDQYDVRDNSTAGREVRNLGMPVDLAGGLNICTAGHQLCAAGCVVAQAGSCLTPHGVFHIAQLSAYVLIYSEPPLAVPFCTGGPRCCTAQLLLRADGPLISCCLRRCSLAVPRASCPGSHIKAELTRGRFWGCLRPCCARRPLLYRGR